MPEFEAPKFVRKKRAAKPLPSLDRKKLRDAIDKAYNNTLNYLGR